MPARQRIPLFADPPLGRPARPRAAPPETPAIADARQLSLTPGQHLRTRVAGIFLFLPLLARFHFERLVAEARYPGSRMVPAVSALLSLLALKLLDKERHSHINDFNFDEALGWFAGLNILPKKSYATDYSYRTRREQHRGLLSGWIQALAPALCPEAKAFCLDFHPIPYRGDASGLENHYLPRRGHAGTSVLTFFAHEPKQRVLCYGNANLLRANQFQEWLQFVEFWHTITGRDPEWLYFDSKLVPYAELSRINQRGIQFVTIRRRGAAIVRRLQALPASAWHKTVLDIPKRRHQHARFVVDNIHLSGYEGTLRQIAVRGLGREDPSLFVTNNQPLTAREIILRYAGRNSIEDALGTSVNFFHLDCLASEVRLNVDLDVALTVIAHGCYRWLGTQLRGFDKAKPKQLYRKFVETGGTIQSTEDALIVHFDKRAHNPVLREAALDQASPPIPWLGNRPILFRYP